MVYYDDISFFVVCFQIFSLESETVPYLYRCWVLVIQIDRGLMTYNINKLYLVVHYVESHVLGGKCCVKADWMLSTSIIA